MLPRWHLPVVTALTFAMSVSAHAATIQITMETPATPPAEVSAKVGDTIEWINKDIFAHTATARNGDWDVTMPPKKTITLVLKTAGITEYYCRFLPNLKATLGGATLRARETVAFSSRNCVIRKQWLPRKSMVAGKAPIVGQPVNP